MSEAIDKDVYFSCTIDAVTGNVIESGWEGKHESYYVITSYSIHYTKLYEMAARSRMVV